MAEFYGSVMTDLGASLLADAVAGTAQIQFTSLKTGDGTYTEEERSRTALQARTALKSLKQSTSFSSVERQATARVVLDAIVSNESLLTGYYVREVGIYAKDASDPSSTPILYAISVAKAADYMPPYDGLMPTTITEKYIATVDNSAEIVIESTGAYAAAEDLGNVPDLQTTDKSSAVAAINEIVQLTDFLRYDNTGSHNSRYRGKNLGTSVTAAQYAAINAGTFDDMYIGDYWVIDGITWRIADIDYWLGFGDTECTKHHIVIVPDQVLGENKKMNDTDTTAGCYVGSKMYTTYIADARNIVKAAFGSTHILNHREYFCNALASGAGYPSAGAWYDSEIDLMNEPMVYGSLYYSPQNGDGSKIPVVHTIDDSQLALFRHNAAHMIARHSDNTRAHWWLRDVVSASSFAFVNGTGTCYSYHASDTTIGVRPAFAICAA